LIVRALGLAVVWALAGPGTAKAAEPSGRWEVTGSGPGIADYQGRLLVEERGKTHALQWNTDQGKFGGVGLVVGRRFYVGWGTGRGYGLGVLTRDGVDWTGSWVEPASVGMQGKERWSPVDVSGLVGTWDVQGALPGLGGDYGGRLTVSEEGEVYRLEWDVLGEQYTGIGIRRGSHLVVVWGSPEAAGLAEYRVRRRRGRGRWIRVDGVGWGKERLKRLAP
jgi:hypothetical protein